jgi:hypothetical protein
VAFEAVYCLALLVLLDCLKALRGHLFRHGKLVNVYVVNGFKQVVVGDGAIVRACFGHTRALSLCAGILFNVWGPFSLGYV